MDTKWIWETAAYLVALSYISISQSIEAHLSLIVSLIYRERTPDMPMFLIFTKFQGQYLLYRLRTSCITFWDQSCYRSCYSHVTDLCELRYVVLDFLMIRKAIQMVWEVLINEWGSNVQIYMSLQLKLCHIFTWASNMRIQIPILASY